MEKILSKSTIYSVNSLYYIENFNPMKREEPPFETERLILRIHQWADAELVFSYASNPEVAHFMPWKAHETVDDSFEYISRIRQERKNGIRFDHAIVWKESKEVIGSCSYRFRGHKAILGYAINQRFWGKGIATEAARKLVEVVFADPAILRAEAICDVENIGSARVMEKVGMQREGLLRQYIQIPALGELPKDVYMYSILRSEWKE